VLVRAEDNATRRMLHAHIAKIRAYRIAGRAGGGVFFGGGPGGFMFNSIFVGCRRLELLCRGVSDR